MKKSLLRRFLILVILAVIAVLPVFADQETEASEAYGPERTLAEAAYHAATKASAAAGDYFWKVTPAADPVKCKGGVMASPAGDLNAEAPDLDAKGAALYSYDLGQIVYGKNENERLEPYSTTKLLTCWLALEKLDPDSVVTVSEKATQVYENGTTIWLKPGEEITVRDLVYGAMLESGNDAAYAIGEAVAGSEADFAELMNRIVAEWGCNDTHFVNANGWKHKDHYSTAHDMAIITAKCLESQELREIATTKKYTAKATNLSGERQMKNYFLHVTGGPEGLTGGKTGTWDDDDCAVVCSFTEAGIDAVIVVLGDTEDGRPEDVRKLMAFSHEVTPGFIVPTPESVITTAMVRHGEKTKTVLKADGVTYAYPAENSIKEITTEIKRQKLEAPIKKGQEVGEVLVYENDELIGEHKLIATENIETGWFPSYVYISNQATLNGIKVIVAFVVLLTLINMIGSRLGSKKVRKAKKETRDRLREKYRSKH